MRFTILFLCLVLGSSQVQAQKDSVQKTYVFKITDYINVLSDSFTVVQVVRPASFPVPILDKQLGILQHCYKTGETLDTNSIGYGRCNLIKGEYYYFGIKVYKGQKASAGDLLYLRARVPYVYDGLLLNVMNHAIGFTDVYGNSFLNSDAVFTNAKTDELRILDSMVSDIKFTGNAMLQQMPAQNQPIKGGIYDGKNLFDAMMAVKRNELELFLKYVAVRPKIYAGNNWKISETFATWMVSSTPAPIEK